MFFESILQVENVLSFPDFLYRLRKSLYKLVYNVHLRGVYFFLIIPPPFTLRYLLHVQNIKHEYYRMNKRHAQIQGEQKNGSLNYTEL